MTMSSVFLNYFKLPSITATSDTIKSTVFAQKPINISTDDMIKLININSRKYKRLFTYPLKIIKIQENCISCNLEDEYKNITDEGIDMKMLNISNQNIIYFN